MVSRSSQLKLTSAGIANCTFVANRAGRRGGAISNCDQCVLTLTKCTFTSNTAGSGGGALANDREAIVTTIACVFEDNAADAGDADIDSDATCVVHDGLPASVIMRMRNRTRGRMGRYGARTGAPGGGVRRPRS